MSLFQLGDFISHSGVELGWKIECDALSDEDIETLAALVSELVGPFSHVEGIPSGGVRLAKALEKYVDEEYCCYLVVDDVLTTGKSFEEYDYDVGCVIFARGPLPTNVKALFKYEK